MLKASFTAKTFYNALRAIFNKFGSGAHRYTFGPGVPVLGPELAPSLVVANWTGGSGGVITEVSGAINIANGATNSFANGSTVTTVIGTRYKLSFTNSGAGLNSINLYVRDAANVTSDMVAGVSVAAGASYETEFVANTTTTQIRVFSIGASGTNARFSVASIKEILSYTDTYDGFRAGNYTDSAGTTVGAIDSPIGLVLDSAGSVGANLAASLNISSPFGQGYSNLIGGVSGIPVSSPANKTFKITYTISQSNWTGDFFHEPSGGCLPYATYNKTVGTWTYHVKADDNDGKFNFQLGGAGSPTGTITFSSFVIQEVTGIHATQATAGNKPVMRRGIVNLLRWSNDQTNAVWGSGNITGKTASSLSFVAVSSAYSEEIQAITGGTANKTLTVAALISVNSGTANFRLKNTHSGVKDNYSADLTATTVPTIFTLTVTNGASAGDGNQIAGIWNAASSPSSATFNVGGIAIFEGTWTAAQILSYGGIPLTTTVAASSSAGPVYAEFLASAVRHLSIGSVPFQMADDHAVVVSFSPKRATLQQQIVCPSYVGSSRLASIGISGTGYLFVEWYDGVTYVPYTGGASPIVSGGLLVVTAQRLGASLIVRVNGVQVFTGAAFSTSVTTTGSSIASGPLGPSDANIYDIHVVKGTLSLSDIQVMEANAARKAGGKLVGGAFVSNI
jgi:hypothetical protein